MVFINDKKFACATCIKGHRVSGCTHTDRPLFEVKKKGRPATQCQCCKDKRKAGNVHNKCVCGEYKGPEVILPPGHPGIDESSNPYAAGPSGTSTDAEDEDMDMDLDDNGAESSAAGARRRGKGKAKGRRETKKGRPGDQATFPNGLRDVHEMAAAAEVLSELNEDSVQRAERTVASLLNPCTCKHTGICKCCEPKRPRNRKPLTHSRSPSADRGRRDSTDNLVQLFKSRAPSPYGSTASSPNHSNPSPISPAGRYSSSNTLSVPSAGVTVENQHHPAHTSRHVHKTKLYSPYSSGEPGHRRRGSASSRRSISGASVKSLRLRPLADMSKFLSAALNSDGSTATEINRSAVGLPGISSFDEMARKAGVKVEPMDEGMEVDGDEPLSFPTQEDVVLGACTCGEDCNCPGCATHPGHGEGNSDGTHECGSNCRSHFDCGGEVSVPSGMVSIDQLLSVAASAVPRPIRHRPLDQLALDTSLMPPSAAFSPDAAAGLGVVELKPLQCCNGRCQCTPGTCGCKEDCCGCCVRCACAEDAPTPTQDNPAPMAAKQEAGGGSCCGGTDSARQSLSISTATLTPPYGPSNSMITPPRLSPNSAAGLAAGHAFNMSPLHSPLIQANSAHQHRHSLSASSLPSPIMGPTSPGLLQPPAPGSSSGSSCCSPAANSVPLLQVNTALQPSPFSSPAHSPAAEHFYQLPSPSLGTAPMLDTMVPGVDGPLSAPAIPFDASQGIRRASSPAYVAAQAQSLAQGPISGPVYGHSHTQSLSASSAGGRRSTITGGANIHRSASTGKQASKALALAQQANHAGQHMHVRPILPKPNAPPAATLLVPQARPKGSSRPSSPGGRRRSSSSLSRGPSPGPSSRPSSHQHRASESAIGSMGMGPHGQQDVMPLPMVTTSAPGETRQEVSFDPNEDNRDSSEERHEQEEEEQRRLLLQQQQQQQQRDGNAPIIPLQITPELAQMFQAWLVQNGHVRSPTEDQQQQQQYPERHGSGMSHFGGQSTTFSPTSQQPFGPSGTGGFGFDTMHQAHPQHSAPQQQVPDFSHFSFDPSQYASTSSQYLQQAMLELNGAMAGGDDFSSQAQSQPLDVFAAMQAQMMQNHGQQPIPFDQVQQQYLQFQAQAQAPQQQMPMPHIQQAQGDVGPYFSGMPGMSGYVGMGMNLGMGQGQQMSSQGSGMVQQGEAQGMGGWQMPLQQSSQQQQQTQPQQRQRETPQRTQIDPALSQLLPNQGGNLIDLSKPLDSTDVDRIIKALQEQQSRQSQQPAQAPTPSQQQQQQQQHRPSSSQGFSMPPPQVPPPRLGQGHGHSLSQNNMSASSSGAMTPNNIFGFGTSSTSASGATSQLSSSAPQSSGMMYASQLGQSQGPGQDQMQNMFGAGATGGLRVGVGAAAGSQQSHGVPSSSSHTPSFSISSFDSLLAPPSSESSGSGMLSGRTSFTLDTDRDVFEQFIMENSGEGFDLSALDLGAVQEGDSGMGLGMDMGSGMEGEGVNGLGIGVGIGVDTGNGNSKSRAAAQAQGTLGDYNGQSGEAQTGETGQRGQDQQEAANEEEIMAQYTFL